MEDLGADGSTVLEWILVKLDGKGWTECIWLRVVISGRLL